MVDSKTISTTTRSCISGRRLEIICTVQIAPQGRKSRHLSVMQDGLQRCIIVLQSSLYVRKLSLVSATHVATYHYGHSTLDRIFPVGRSATGRRVGAYGTWRSYLSAVGISHGCATHLEPTPKPEVSTVWRHKSGRGTFHLLKKRRGWMEWSTESLERFQMH